MGKKISDYFEYYQKDVLDEIPNVQMLIVGGFSEYRDLVSYYHDILKLPIHATNWDAFEEGLHDCSWIMGDVVSLVHSDLPRLPLGDMKIFLEILGMSVALHQHGPVSEFILPQRKVDFRVYFPNVAREEIERVAAGKEIKLRGEYR